MSFELHKQDLEALALGGALFGCGGGGTVQSARNLASRFVTGGYYPVDSVRVISVEEAIAEAAGEAVMVAYLGAPEPINRAEYPVGPVEAVRGIQARLAEQGRKLAYIVPPEMGALGFVVACLVAARLGLSVLDADGAARAVPSLPMLTFAAAGVNPRPAFLVAQNGLSVELNVALPEDASGAGMEDIAAIAEKMMRPVVTERNFGQFGGLAMWAMDASQFDRAIPIRGTLSLALSFGRVLGNGEVATPADAIRFAADRHGLAMRAITEPGRFVSASIRTAGGFDVGVVRIGAGVHEYTVLYQNESLLVWDSARSRPIMIAPDSVAYFVEGAGAEQAVYTNGDLIDAEGKLNPALGGCTVTLLAWEAAEPLIEPGGVILDSFLDLLKSMGYYGPYVPLNRLLETSEG